MPVYTKLFYIAPTGGHRQSYSLCGRESRRCLRVPMQIRLRPATALLWCVRKPQDLLYFRFPQNISSLNNPK